MNALRGAATALMAIALAVCATLGCSVLIGPEALSGPWPWRVLGLVLWLVFGSVTTHVCHLIGEGLQIGEERRAAEPTRDEHTRVAEWAKEPGVREMLMDDARMANQ